MPKCMKNYRNLFYSACIVAGSLTLAMCNTPTKQESSKDVHNFEIAEVYKIASASYKCVDDTTFGDSVSVYTSASISVLWPTKFGDNDIKPLQDSLLSKAFSSHKSTIDSTIIDYIAKPIGYGDVTLEKVDSVPLPSENVRILSREMKVHTIGFTDELVVFRMDYFEYAGGAHPSYACNYLNYDIKNNSILDYKTMFKVGSEEAIKEQIKSHLLAKYFAKDMAELAENSGIFTDDIFVSHNIFIRNNDIVFFYNPYEIGPWAIGAVSVAIPAYELSECLNDNVKGLFYLM